MTTQARMDKRDKLNTPKPVTKRWSEYRAVLGTLLILSMTGQVFGQLLTTQALEPPPTDQIIIKFHSSDRAQATSIDSNYVARLSSIANVGLQHVRPMSGGEQVFKLSSLLPITEAKEIARRLGAHIDVAYAEPDYIMQPLLIPNDSLYRHQWHYHAPANALGAVNLPAAWDISVGSGSVVVAIIDTGLRPHADIDSDMTDSIGRVVPGYDFIATDIVANDGDGRDPDPSDPGDWVTADEARARGCRSSNSSWHGTHVTGTIGALSNNSVGIAGINWNSKILPVRVLGKCGGYSSDIIDGMRWAAGLTVSGAPVNANPAQVLNLSLGAVGPCTLGYQSAIDAITAVNSIVVVAAGNNSIDVSGFFPANCSNVITVAASDPRGDRASFSNYSTSMIEISAPGVSVISTVNTGLSVPVEDSYASYDGTSMAAPHVAGIVSLMLSVNPGLTPAQVLARIQSTARPFPAATSCATTRRCGPGIIDAAAAVAAALPAPTITSLDPVSATAGGTDFTLIVNGSNFLNGISIIRWNGSERATTFVTASQLSATIPAADIAQIGTASVTVVNTISGGGGSSAAQTFTITDPVLTLSSINPDSVTAGSADLLLTLNGVGFARTSVVRWNGRDRVTTYISSSRLTAILAASDLAVAGRASITVFNPPPGAGESSAQTFTVNDVQNVDAGKGKGGGGCFIATAAYGTPMAQDVRYLRAFRDQYLETNAAGRWFITQYYNFSPPLAEHLRQDGDLRALMRIALGPLVALSRALVDDAVLAAQTANRP